MPDPCTVQRSRQSSYIIGGFDQISYNRVLSCLEKEQEIQ